MTEPSHSRHGDAGHCRVCKLCAELATEIESAGDLVEAAVAALNTTDIRWGITHLSTQIRRPMMRSLGLTVVNKPTDLYTTQVLHRLQKAKPDVRGQAVRYLTRPIYIEAVRAAAGPEVDARRLVSELLADTPQGMVRLCLAQWWKNTSRLGPTFLGALMSDERLTLGSWQAIAEQVADSCRRAETAIAELPDEPPSVDLDVPALDADELNEDLATDGTGSPGPDPIEDAEIAVAVAVNAAHRVMDALDDGMSPPSDALQELASVEPALSAAAESVELEVPPPPSLARLREAAESRGAAEEDGLRRLLARLCPARTEGVASDALADLSIEAGALLDEPSWADPARARAEVLVKVVQLVDAVSDEDDEQILALDADLRRELGATGPAVVVAATRARIELPDEAPTAEDADTGGPDSARRAPTSLDNRPGAPPPPSSERVNGPAEEPPDTEVPGEPAPSPVDEAPDDAATEATVEPIPDRASAPETDAIPGPSFDHVTETTDEPTLQSDSVAEHDEPTAEVEDDEYPPEPEAAVDGDLGTLIAARRFGIAAWLAHAAGASEGRVTALQAAALADVMRSPTGGCVTELGHRAGSLSGSALDGDRPAQLLALVAAMRCALLHPHGEMTGVVTELADRVGDIPGFHEVAAAITRAALRGLSVTPDLLPTAQGVATLEQRVHDASVAAAVEIDTPRSSSFQRGTRIFQEWMGNDGLLTRLLAPAKANDQSRREWVAAEVLRLRDHRELDDEIDRIDRRLRGHGSKPIEGHARRKLADRIEQCVAAASVWADACAQLLAHRSSEGQWQEGPLQDLRSVVQAERERLIGALNALGVTGDDPVLAGACTAAEKLLGDAFALLDGTPLEGMEAVPALVMHGDLLKSPSVHIDAELIAAPGTEVSVDAVIEAAGRSWEQGFEARCDVDDYLAADKIVAIVSTSDTAFAGVLRAQMVDRLDRAVRRIQHEREPLAIEVDRARRYGYLDEDAWREQTLAIEGADPTERLDLAGIESDLDAVRRVLARHRVEEIASFHEEFIAKCEAEALVGDRSDAILRIVEQGDLATARDMMARAEAGDEAAAGGTAGEQIAAFFPGVPDAMPAGLTETEIAQAEAGAVAGGVDFSELSPGEREVAGRGLHAWHDAATLTRQPSWLGLLAPALRILGIEADTERSPKLPGGPDRRWVDLMGVRRTGKALVPAFGSASGSELRLLLCWGSPEVSTVLGWISQDASEKPILVIYFATMGAQRRIALGRAQREGQRRAVAVVDDAAVLYLAARGAGRFESTMLVTLPFAAVNPYEPFAAGAVPAEMFYGRSTERSSVMDQRGTSLIYGGRQLGKSALLHAAERRFNDTPGYRAVYVDLRKAAIGATKRPEAVWDLLADALVSQQVAERRPQRKEALVAVEEMIRTWLDDDPTRRMLLLLDECDEFFDADADARFVNTSRLRDLMDSSGRRIKAVFAGLHQVQRFAAIPNQPLAHLGQPQVIGPLAAQPAFDLLHDPLEALGFTLGDDLAARLMANANYQPLALQLYGRALADVLLSAPMPGTLPVQVTEADIDAVIGDKSLADEIQQRFVLTLRLDPRYRVIAYAVAYRAHESGHDRPLSAQDLRDECQTWWPAAFAKLRPDEFRGLVEEMAGLGVLAAVPGGWRLRSPNVRRMLGSVAEVEEALYEAEHQPPPVGFAAAEERRILDPDDGTRSPLSEGQLADLLAVGHNRVHVVLGSDACGVRDVGAALEAGAAGGRSNLLQAKKRMSYQTLLKGGEPGEHRVVLSVLDARDEACQAALDSALGTGPPSKVTRSVVLVVPSANLSWWSTVLGREGDDVAIVELRRHSERSLWVWAVEVPSAFQDEAGRAELLQVTGGWPLLVERAGERAAAGFAQQEIIPEIRADLESRGGSTELIEAIGLTSDPELQALWEAAVDLVEEPVDLVDLASLAPNEKPDPDAAVAALRALGVLNVDADGKVMPEPVAAAAWRRSRRAE